MPRQHVNIAVNPSRVLKQKFTIDAVKYAVGTTAPNNLRGGNPSQLDKMATAGDMGVYCFIVHDPAGGTTQDLNVFFWNPDINRLDPAAGWVQCSNISTSFGQDCPDQSLCTVAAPEGTDIFVQAGTQPIPYMVDNGKRDLNNLIDNTAIFDKTTGAYDL